LRRIADTPFDRLRGTAALWSDPLFSPHANMTRTEIPVKITPNIFYTAKPLERKRKILTTCKKTEQ
jgi:hypothetical protein